jgi:hypothetical protein
MLETPAVARCRPFTIADALILVAATAPSLCYFKLWWPEYFQSFQGQRYISVLLRLDARLCGVSAFVSCWTFAWLILRHRRPRPTRQNLGRQFGMAGCLAATVAMISAASWVITAGLLSPLLPRVGPGEVEAASWVITVGLLRAQEIFSWSFPLEVTFYNGYAVLATWVVLAYGGQWQREPGWIDAMGTALGGFWVARMLLRTASVILENI